MTKPAPGTWTSQLDSVDRQTLRGTLSDAAGVLSFGRVIELWRDEDGFRRFFAAVLAQSPFDAFFWETPPLTRQTLNRPFEFVLTESGPLARARPDASSFESQFSAQPEAMVVNFPNMGGDAILVVPAPIAGARGYTHLARFLRDAPGPQVSTLWQQVGAAMSERVSDSPTWLSTAGMGVPWLHLRLDSRPKYYRYRPYALQT